MLKTVKIENFRGFQSFELSELGRINLLVGKNNSGKTSVLEAVQLLRSHNHLKPLIDILRNRGEFFWGDCEKEPEFDIRHLFYDRKIEPGSQFSILGINRNHSEEKVTASIKVHDDADDSYSQLQLFEGNRETSDFNSIDDINILEFILKWEIGTQEEIWKSPLSENGGLSYPYKYIRDRQRKFLSRTQSKRIETQTQFVTPSSLTVKETMDLFDRVVLTPEENLIEEALQTIEPKIERIASVGSDRVSGSRGGFFVSLSDSNRRIPIGSMGNGIWRMLGLALATVGASNGILIVDEIDTGLHFSTMSDMWALIWKVAKKLNVQVFATTHSSDCWMSLATLANREDIEEDGITIQRIEPEKHTSVAFHQDEIVMAAQRDIEVR
ncbi:ATP-binding protein [Geitlerinema sp. PCC 9228]|uniref:AAA family ATPase n=1 Tax=Geitlerinema sp. PCC 9228 TaxID=111611 RepID=UPI0008F9E0E9|nr:ATP-binding protein [Geitlerinema sp. PCC 9228]